MYWIATYPLDRVIHSLNNWGTAFTFGMGWVRGSLWEGILRLKIGLAAQNNLKQLGILSYHPKTAMESFFIGGMFVSEY